MSGNTDLPFALNWADSRESRNLSGATECAPDEPGVDLCNTYFT